MFNTHLKSDFERLSRSLNGKFNLMTESSDVKEALYAIQIMTPANRQTNKTIWNVEFLCTKQGLPPALAFMAIQRFFQ